MKERGTRENDEMQMMAKPQKMCTVSFVSFLEVLSHHCQPYSWPAVLLLVIAASKGLFVYNKNYVVYAAIQSTC
jgi:hypothetical protein